MNDKKPERTSINLDEFSTEELLDILDHAAYDLTDYVRIYPNTPDTWKNILRWTPEVISEVFFSDDPVLEPGEPWLYVFDKSELYDEYETEFLSDDERYDYRTFSDEEMRNEAASLIMTIFGIYKAGIDMLLYIDERYNNVNNVPGKKKRKAGSHKKNEK